MKKKNYKYPYVPDKSLFAAVMIAKKALTQGNLFKRAVKWAADKTSTDPEDVEYYLSIFLDCDNEESEESDNSDLISVLIDIKELVNESLSCIYFGEGDGETNHYMYHIEECLNEINSSVDWCIGEIESETNS